VHDTEVRNEHNNKD